MPLRLLVIDDDVEIHALIKKSLGPHISLDTVVELPSDARELDPYDLIILDLMLEKINALGFLTSLKKTHEDLLDKIVLLTGSGRIEDEIEIHKLGVRDYIKKPFNPKVLAAVVDKHLTALRKNSSDLRFGPFILDPGDFSIFVGDRTHRLELTNTEFKILKTLLESRGRIVTRERLMTDVWDIDNETQTRTVDMHMSSLRKKMYPYGELLKTKRGIGYFLEEREGNP